MIIHPAKWRYNSSTKIVFDGNSLFALTAPIRISEQLADTPLISGTGTTIANVAISGQAWGDMSGSAADVDAQWPASGKGILVCWEGTNDIGGGASPQACVDHAKTYVQGRLALHPWKIVVLTTLPRRYTSQVAANLAAYNDLLKQQYRDVGAHAVCDVRQRGSPFDFTGTTDAPFIATQRLWLEWSNWIHLSTDGCAVVTKYLEATLRRLPAK